MESFLANPGTGNTFNNNELFIKRANGIIAAPHSLLGASAVAMMQQRPDMNVRPIGILWHLPTKVKFIHGDIYSVVLSCVCIDL